MRILSQHYRSVSASLVSACMLLLLTGCFDDEYDLSDIDTTAQLSVNDLVLPINIDDITLESLITIDENSRIKEVDGAYVLTEDGTFSSSSIYINAISIAPTSVEPITIALGQSEATAQVAGRRTSTAGFDLGRHTSDFAYTTYGVSEYIESMSHIGTTFTIDMVLSIVDPGKVLGTCHLTDLSILLPIGLEGTPSIGSYDKASGLVTIGTVDTTNGSIEFKMDVTGIDLSVANINFNATTHTFKFADEVGIASGKVVPTVIPSHVPDGTAVKANFALSHLDIETFSGTVSYALAGMGISPISLSDLPDVLMQSETDISLSNPQIYLSITNPLSGYGISAQAGLSITPWRNATAGQSYGLDNGYFTIGSSAGIHHYCFAPTKPSSYQAGYTDASFEPYSGLHDILHGEGLPSQLVVDIVDPKMPSQHVNALPIGKDLGNIEGTYLLYAPLALADGSKIVYTYTEDGWNDEDVDALTIEKLELNATADNDLPVSIVLSGYPIDVNGNRIAGTSITPVTLKGETKGEPISLQITGNVTHLDGITFTASVTAADANKPLSPSESLSLHNITVKVSGHYTKEL